MNVRRLMLMIFDAVLIISLGITVIVAATVVKERRDAKRIEDVRTLLGVVYPSERKN